jgi:membrane fusion protein (multidrug efflux system)
VLPDGSTYPVRGKLNFAASQIDPKLGTLQLRGEFANPDGRLLPGQFVRARLITGERDGVFKVPQAAVMQTDKGPVVMPSAPTTRSSRARSRPASGAARTGSSWAA